MAAGPIAVDSGGMMQMASKGGVAAAGPVLGGASGALVSSRSTIGRGGLYGSNMEMSIMGGGGQASGFMSEYREGGGAYDQLALPDVFLADYYAQVGNRL